MFNLLYYLLPCKICGSQAICTNNGFECSICKENNRHECLGGGLEFKILQWNVYQADIDIYGKGIFPSLNIDGNDDWYFGELYIRMMSLGFSEKFEKTFILFRTSLPKDEWFISKKSGYTCIIDRDRYLHDLEILDIHGKRIVIDYLNMPKSKSMAYAYFCLHTDGFSKNNHPCIYLNTMSWKYNELSKNIVKTFEPNFDFYRSRERY